jgi:hypothetical protein
MVDWRKLQVPQICERMIGFSVPIDNQVLVVSYEGTHLIHLGSPITVETDEEFAEYDIYDPDTGMATYRGKTYSIIGLYDGNGVLESPQGESLLLNQEDETISVLKGTSVEFSMKYENFSGGWAAATFSPDGRYIVLGCPYDFDFIVLERSFRA